MSVTLPIPPDVAPKAPATLRLVLQPLQQKITFDEATMGLPRIPPEQIPEALAQIKRQIRVNQRVILNVEPHTRTVTGGPYDGWVSKPEVPVVVYVNGGSRTTFQFDTVAPYGNDILLRDFIAYFEG
jgi:hypothetical protein